MGYMQDANAIAAQLRGRAKPAPAKNRWPSMPAAGKQESALTPTQLEMLGFMRKYLAENDQLPPVTTVATKFDMYPGGAQWHMAEMARKGAIEKNAAGRWRFARGAR